MKAYLLRRFIGLFPVLFISSFLIFLIIHLIPGDPAVLLVPEVPPPTKEDIDAMRALYGFDKPILEHNLRLCKNIGIKTILINLHYLPDTIINYFGDGSKENLPSSS